MTMLGSLLGPAMVHADVPNDSYFTAQPFSEVPFSVEVDTTEALTEPLGDPGNACAPIHHSVWYRFEPTADAQVRIDTAGSDFTAGLAVYYGEDFLSLRQVACDATFQERPAQVPLGVAAGMVYYIQAGGAAAGIPWPDTAGTLHLNVTATSGPINHRPPLHDDRADAEIITALPFEDVVYVHSASYEGLDPFPNDADGNVWYRYAPTEDVTVAIRALRSYPVFSFRVFEEEPGGGLVEVAESKEYINTRQRALALRAGGTYLLEVEGARGHWDDDPVHLSVEVALQADLVITSLTVTETLPGSYDASFAWRFDSGPPTGASWTVQVCPASPAGASCSTVAEGVEPDFLDRSARAGWFGAGCVGDAEVRVTVESLRADPDLSSNVRIAAITFPGAGHGAGVCPPYPGS